jgi:molecular chaperone IbpA
MTVALKGLTTMRTTFDFTPYRRAAIGFDRLFDVLENAANYSANDTYPPYDIERQGEDAYRITLAIAGFKPDEVDMTAHQNLLIVTGKKATNEDSRNFVHRGIAARSFERKFELADYVQVHGAALDNGLLTIDLVREVPEAMKPRKIAIGNHPQTTAPAIEVITENKKAA